MGGGGGVEGRGVKFKAWPGRFRVRVGVPERGLGSSQVVGTGQRVCGQSNYLKGPKTTGASPGVRGSERRVGSWTCAWPRRG